MQSFAAKIEAFANYLPLQFLQKNEMEKKRHSRLFQSVTNLDKVNKRARGKEIYFFFFFCWIAFH